MARTQPRRKAWTRAASATSAEPGCRWWSTINAVVGSVAAAAAVRASESGPPDSATHQLVRALAALLARPAEWRLEPPVARFLQALGRVDPRESRFAADPGAALGPAGPAPDLPPGFEALLADTLQVTTLAASDRINVVAPEATARIDVRLLPGSDAGAFLAKLRETVGPRIDVRVLLEPGPQPAPSPAAGRDWRSFERALADGAPIVPVVISGITDSRYFRQRGIAAYGISPFALEALDVRRVHGPDERIPLATFDAGVRRMTRLVLDLVGAAARSADKTMNR